MMALEIKMLRPGDAAALSRVAPDLFDHAVQPRLAREFLADPRHHIAVAAEDGVIVGFASALHYVHPDKPAELWINELAVAPSHRRRGLAKQILATLFAHGTALGCDSAWVLTDADNAVAQALYANAGGRKMKPDPVGFEFRLDNPEGTAS
jgi:ribosomal protein S18 acetylase RimI-like enzyme